MLTAAARKPPLRPGESVGGHLRQGRPHAGAVGHPGDGRDLRSPPHVARELRRGLPLPKLVRSYAIDALEAEGGNGKGARKGEAEDFLSKLAEARVETYEAVGLGTDLRLTSPELIGGGLVVDDRLLHLAAFATESDTATAESRSGQMARMRSRRRSYSRR